MGRKSRQKFLERSRTDLKLNAERNARQDETKPGWDTGGGQGRSERSDSSNTEYAKYKRRNETDE
jgi:hypothetical protein